MSPTMASLGLDKLTVAERRALANELWVSTEVEGECGPISDEFRAELRRRADDAIQNPDAGVSWEEVWAKVESQHGRRPAPLSQSQLEELDRRIAEDDANPDDVFTWDEVKQEIRRKLGSKM